jgi:hypothetical protein
MAAPKADAQMAKKTPLSRPISARSRPCYSQLAKLCVALNTYWESRPRWGPRYKHRKFRAELVRIIQSTNGNTNDVICFEILHIVDCRVNKQAATASSTESTVDSRAAICDHFVTLGCTLAQIECASRPTNNEYLVCASEVLTVPTITEILACRLGCKLVDNISATAPS